MKICWGRDRLLTPVSLVAQLVKNLPECGRPGFDRWVGKIPWSREQVPTPVFWLHGLCIVHGVAKTQTHWMIFTHFISYEPTSQMNYIRTEWYSTHSLSLPMPSAPLSAASLCPPHTFADPANWHHLVVISGTPKYHPPASFISSQFSTSLINFV